MANRNKRKSKSPKKAKAGTRIVQYITNNMTTSCTVRMLNRMNFFQRTTHNLISKLPFSRLVREIFQELRAPLRVRAEALEALQISAEHYLTELFTDANRCASHAKRVTVQPIDIKLVLDLRGKNDAGRR